MLSSSTKIYGDNLLLYRTLVHMYMSVNILHYFFQDDFLLIHYDKGQCRSKLGHSRASLIWHHTQVSGVHGYFKNITMRIYLHGSFTD